MSRRLVRAARGCYARQHPPGTVMFTQTDFTAMDAWLAGHVGGDDAVLAAATARADAAGLPAIAVSELQGKLLHLLAKLIGAQRILEIGTLAGYSTIWLARGLAEGGRVDTLEIDPRHANVAAANFAAAGLADRITLHRGVALDLLPSLAGPYDLVFIDADKQNNAAYFDAAIRLSRPGGVIIVDNVVREGGLLDTASTDPRIEGTRRLFDAIAGDARVEATAIQTVGTKKWDGFVLARVR